MKFLLIMFFSFNAFGAIKVSNYSCTTGALNGTCTISITVPGTFTTIDPTSSTFSGRQLLKAGLWLENRTSGDKITSMAITDPNGKIPVPYRALFPSYPTLRTLYDTGVSEGNQGIVLPPGDVPFQIDFPNTGSAKAASELVLVLTVTKASGLGIDTARMNITWDDLN